MIILKILAIVIGLILAAVAIGVLVWLYKDLALFAALCVATYFGFRLIKYGFAPTDKEKGLLNAGN